MTLKLDDKEGVALASGHHLKCEALSDDVIGIRHGNPGHGATWIYCSATEAQAIQAQLAEAIAAAARPAQAMSDEDLLRHQDTHTKENSWPCDCVGRGMTPMGALDACADEADHMESYADDDADDDDADEGSFDDDDADGGADASNVFNIVEEEDGP